MIEYKGYEIIQSYNYHVTIFQDGKKVFHAQCNKIFTDDELKNLVDEFFEIVKWFLWKKVNLIFLNNLQLIGRKGKQMKKKKKYYYSLFDEYRKIIVEMKFNQNFSNRNRLDEIVKELDKQISIFVTNINKRKFFIISSRIIYYFFF